jgi:hypothetical protein
MMKASCYADGSKLKSRCGPQVELAVVNGQISDASLVQNRRKGHNDTS